MPIFRVALGYEELFGAKPSWDDLVGRLRLYNLSQVLGTLGRITGVLDQLDRKHAEAQKRVCDGLLGDEGPRVWQEILRWIRQEKANGAPESEPSLFHDLQLISFAKVAFLHLEPGSLEGEPPLRPLGEALLMLSNLQHGVLGDNPGADPSTPDGARIWHQHFIANGLFHHNDVEIHALPRFYDLYLTDKPHLRGHPAYVDLPARLKQASGLSPDGLWFILFALMAHWRNIEPDAIGEGMWVMDRSIYFGGYAFPREDIDRFYALVGIDIGSMKREIMRTYSMTDLRPFHVLPFAKWPLVEMGNRVFCVSVKLLKQKLTTGLHHLFLDEEKFPDKRDRRRYLDYIGAVFEDYVSRLLDRAFPPAFNRCLKADVLSKAIGDGKSCDFLILYGDAVILLETKATRFTLGARTEENWGEYERQFADIFIDGAGQIGSTIEAIEAGKLTHLGIDPSRVRSYFPLVVTLEDLPMNRVVYRRVYEEIAKARLLQSPKTRPLQAIDIGELEFIEIGLHSGRSLRDILQEKLASDDSRDESMSNYLIARREPFILKPVNEYLGALFTQIGDRAVEFFRRNQRTKTGQ